MTILIANATGRTQGYVIRALLELSPVPALRLHGRSAQSLEKLAAAYPQLVGANAFIAAEPLNHAELVRALDGVSVVWYNGPEFVPHETAMGVAMIEAAREAGVKHFVFSSTIFPQLTKCPNHVTKLSIEEYLIESGLPYTIIQPTILMQNDDLKAAVASSQFPALWTPSIVQSFVDLFDVAAVARLVLTDPATHAYATYTLVGENGSYDDVARTLGAVSGKKIEVVRPPPEAIVEGFSAAKGITSQNGKDGFARLLFYFGSRGIPGNSNTLRWLLGREPTSWKEMMKRELGLA